MIVSLEAIFLSTFVMISQNRADAKRQVVANLEWKTVREEDRQNRGADRSLEPDPGADEGDSRRDEQALMGLTERLARASSRHPWRVLLGWLGAIVLALGLAVTLLPGNLTTNGHVTNNPESAQAERIFYRDFPPDRSGVDELIVVRSPTRTVVDPPSRRFAAGLWPGPGATGVVHRASALGGVSGPSCRPVSGIQRQADVDPLLAGGRARATGKKASASR